MDWRSQFIDEVSLGLCNDSAMSGGKVSWASTCMNGVP